MLWTRAARPSTGRTQRSPFHIAVGSSQRRIGPFSSLRNTRDTCMIFFPVLRLIKRRFYSKLLYKYFYIFLSWKSLQINQFIFLCPTKFFERDSIQSVISHVFSQALTSKSLNHHRVANSSRVVATQCDIDIFLSTDLGKIDIYQRHFRGNYYYCHITFPPRVEVWDGLFVWLACSVQALQLADSGRYKCRQSWQRNFTNVFTIFG